MVEFVKTLQKEMGNRLVFVRGSHEYLLLTSKTNIKNRLLWQIVGKHTTLKSFKKHGAKLMDYEGWIQNNSVLYYKGEGFQCAHAGVKDESIENNDEYTLLMDHGIVKKNVYRGKLTITGHIHLKQPMYFDGMGGDGRILKYDTWEELPKVGVICIDTGISEGGMMTAIVIKDNKYITDQTWGEAINYDICLDSSTLGIEKCIAIIMSCMDEE